MIIAKLFDSVRRSELVEAMIAYKIHPKVRDTVTNIYQGDKTTIRLNDDTAEKLEVTSGIRQGCTGSTTLFKIVTYIIMKEIHKTTLGFRSERFYTPVLFFADDGVDISKITTRNKDSYTNN